MSDWRVAVELIRGDNRSGASALLRQAADALALAADNLPQAGPGWRAELEGAARAVASVRPAIGALCRLAGAALAAAEGAATRDVASVEVRRAVRGFARRVEHEAPAIAARAARLIRPGDVVVTISASSLVERALLAAASVGHVVCLESRPACEGAALAGHLAAAGLDVTLVSDAAGPRMVARARLVLLGGDTLAPAGLVHKVGTFGLALAARHCGAEVHALVGREKWLPAPLLGALDDGGPPEELLAGRLAGLAVANPYFDLTPLRLLDGIVGPTTTWTAATVGRRAGRVVVYLTLRDLLEAPSAVTGC